MELTGDVSTRTLGVSYTTFDGDDQCRLSRLSHPIHVKM